MKIGIIGSGAIGLLMSSYLKQDHEVTVYVHRHEQKAQLSEKGITRFKQSKLDKTVRIRAEHFTDLNDEDCYFVCVKQHQIENLIPYLKKIKKPIIFLQNGMGHLKYMKLLERNTYVGVVEHGAKRIDDTTVDHLGNGTIRLANFLGDEEMLKNIIRNIHKDSFPFVKEENYELLLKNKLIVNAVINPLTAIFNIPNGKILTNKHIEKLARKLCKEAATVLELDEEKSWKRVVNTAEITRENTSSMRADILHHRKTEIEAISGYLLEQNENLPYTKFVYHSLLALEKEGNNSHEY